MREKLYQPTCSGCSNSLSYLDFIPQKKFGVMMHCGEHFCIGGKRARRFKKSDPKTRVPDWCPNRKDPCELRVYALKSADDWFLHSMLDEGMGKISLPSASRYAVRFEGSTEMSPREFWQRCEQESAADLLPVSVQLYEVLEIDDGLKPVCFYWSNGTFSLVPLFDGAMARRNVYQGGCEDDE